MAKCHMTRIESNELKYCQQASGNAVKLSFVFLLLAIGSGCAKQEESKETRLTRANDYFAAQQYDKAEKEYREVLRRTPADPVAMRQLGLIYYDQGQLPQAYPLLKKTVALEPDNLEVNFKLAQTYLSGRDTKEARATVLQILNRQPTMNKPRACWPTLPSHLKTSKSRGSLSKAFAKDQDRAGYRVALGQLALRESNQAEAEKEFTAALALDPKSADAHLGLEFSQLAAQ